MKPLHSQRIGQAELWPHHLPRSYVGGRDGNYKIFIRRPANAPDLKKDLDAAKTPEAVMARRREFMMENHLGGSHYSDNDNPDMPSNVVSLDDLENVGRMWKERDSIQVGPNN